MDLKEPKYSKKEVSQKFNLKKLLGVDFSQNPDLRDQIGQALIDRIVERTEKGKDIDGNKFEKYSKAYRQSDDYKDFKGNTRKVNMTLTGRMLDDIDILSETTNTIKIGFEDETETLKAYNHNIGQTVPKRQFFGIADSDLKAVKKEFKSDIADLKKSPPKEKKQTVGELLAEFQTVENFFGES